MLEALSAIFTGARSVTDSQGTKFCGGMDAARKSEDFLCRKARGWYSVRFKFIVMRSSENYKP